MQKSNRDRAMYKAVALLVLTGGAYLANYSTEIIVKNREGKMTINNDEIWLKTT